MRRDFSKKSNAMKRSWRHRFGFASFLGIVAAIFLCSLVLFSYLKKHWQTPVYISAYVTRLNAWIAERKHRLSPMPKIKQLTANKTEAPEPIHFEFYTALPNMQINATDVLNSNDPSLLKNVTTHEKSVFTTAKTPAKMMTTSTFVNAEELEKEFAHEIKQEAYIVQVGSFHTADAAERQRRLLADAGFSAATMKVTTNGKMIYRVEVGPFNNKNQTKVVQQRLYKKGFSGMVRKIEVA